MKLTSFRTQLFALCSFAALAFVMLPLQRLSAQNVNVEGAVVANGTYATLTDAHARAPWKFPTTLASVNTLL